MYSYSLDIVGVVVTGAGQAVVDELEDLGYDVDRVCLMVPGDIAWDECDCGQLAQTVTAVSPSNAFPQVTADTGITPCGPNQLVVAVTLSLIRCVTGPDDSGHSPKCSVLLRDALQIERDRFIARTQLRCYLKNLYDQNLLTGFTVGGATTVGPNGLCAGIEMNYSFGLVNAGCC
jgi:hypothetical protein